MILDTHDGAWYTEYKSTTCATIYRVIMETNDVFVRYGDICQTKVKRALYTDRCGAVFLLVSSNLLLTSTFDMASIDLRVSHFIATIHYALDSLLAANPA